MKDIIIVGVGKASLLHYNSYNKLKKIGKIYFVDIKKSSKYIKNIKIYASIKECIIENQLEKSNLIIDICTPKSEFLSILNICKEENLKDILIEKPFVISEQDLKKYHNLNIVMVENYLYSKITRWIEKYLKDTKKEIRLIFTNFSKNRMPESTIGRGYRNEVTLNYEIEIPHQVYLTQYFLGAFNEISNSITCSRDMKIGDMDLKNHGYGLIISKYKDVDIIYESNLTSFISQKRIIICTKDNYAIEGNYALYSENLSLIKKPNVSVYYDGKLIKNVVFSIDDNFTYFIKEAYNYFNNISPNPNIVSIKDFSSDMKLYCNNLLARKEKNKKS
jgi:predicted dehydrogenase